MEEITVQEVARRLGKNERTIRRWVHTDRIPYRVGADGRLLFQASDIERMRSEQPPSPTIDDALALIHALEGRITALEQALARLASHMPSTMPRQVKTPETHDSASETKQEQPVASSLPGDLEIATAFAKRHGIAESTLKRALQDGRLHGIEGSWLVGRATIKWALDQAGRAQFYEIYHNHPKFTACSDCPHSPS